MKKTLALALVMLLALTMLAGCGGAGTQDGTGTGNAPAAGNAAGDNAPANDAAADEGAEEDLAQAVTVVGPDSGTKMEMWSFVEMHNTFYASMLEKWNAQNPDRQIQITFTTYPYADMHNKMTMALQTGSGAPDLCDIEIGQFPNFMKGEVQLYPLNDALAPYINDLVRARLDIYGKDGKFYGAPTHVGATVMFYNIEILEKYGIDYKTIVTWDDYTEAARKLAEASNGESLMTSVDTGGTDWLWLAMAEYGEDWTGGSEAGPVNVQLQSVNKMLTMQQSWVNEGIAIVSPAGHVDLEEGFQNIIDGKIVSFPKAMWFMSRFINYMPEMAGKIAIAPCPVFEAGQPRSVGIGGTGTVVSNQSSDPALAADFIAYAKCSYDGNLGIWNVLGFDTCNTTIWTDTKITQDTSNQYIAYFATNPFDTLNQIKNEIGKIFVGSISPTINEVINLTTLNAILEDNMDVTEALAEAQSMIELEQ